MVTPTPRRRSQSMKIANLHIPSHIFLTLWSLIALFPIWVLIVNSFKTRFTIYSNPFGLPEQWNFKNYESVLASGDFLNYF